MATCKGGIEYKTHSQVYLENVVNYVMDTEFLSNVLRHAKVQLEFF